MYSFSERSALNLKSAHPTLQTLLKRAIEEVNFTVIEGHRGKEKQNRLYDEGKSELPYPESKHNNMPSLAVDIMPYPIEPVEDIRFAYCNGIIRGLAEEMGIPIRLGIDWNMDGELVKYDEEESFFDGAHIELDEDGM